LRDTGWSARPWVGRGWSVMRCGPSPRVRTASRPGSAARRRWWGAPR
jgi:hypothetical protein